MITGSEFTGNQASGDGGAISNNLGSDPVITGCSFTDNTSFGQGGALYNDASSPAITDCTFSGNYATIAAGGISNIVASSPTIAGCSFTSNRSPGNGGAIYNESTSAPAISNCHFSANLADYGTSIYNTDSSPAIADSNFVNSLHPETEFADGGVVSNYGESSPVIHRCDFRDNATPALVNEEDSAATALDCTFVRNSASSGPAFRDFSSAASAFTRCTFADNTSVGDGGAVSSSGSPQFTDCTFTSNSASGVGGAVFAGDQPRPSSGARSPRTSLPEPGFNVRPGRRRVVPHRCGGDARGLPVHQKLCAERGRRLRPAFDAILSPLCLHPEFRIGGYELCLRSDRRRAVSQQCGSDPPGLDVPEKHICGQRRGHRLF
ncbi:MAG: right-handed parallel beta-helix repeat-containing protein [Verrucomicrobiales bacterium]